VTERCSEKTATQTHGRQGLILSAEKVFWNKTQKVCRYKNLSKKREGSGASATRRTMTEDVFMTHWQRQERINNIDRLFRSTDYVGTPEIRIWPSSSSYTRFVVIFPCAGNPDAGTHSTPDVLSPAFLSADYSDRRQWQTNSTDRSECKDPSDLHRHTEKGRFL